jgi:hypothetical protein
MSPNLKDALDNADGRFNRPPVGNIYVRYVEYAAVEGFPHVEAVARWIAAKEGIDFTEYADALRHEAYLAGQKAKDETRTAEYHAVRNAGYRLATEARLVVGQRYDVLIDKDTAFGRRRTQLVCECEAGAGGDLFLTPRHARMRRLKVGTVNEMWVRDA